jgi:predicted ATPase
VAGFVHEGAQVLRRLELQNFRCFKTFEITFDKSLNVIVGPNNAGKSTVVSALRAAAFMLSTAARRRPTTAVHVNNEELLVFPVNEFPPPLDSENFRWEFHHELPASLTFVFDNEVELHLEWPPEAEFFQGYFYIVVGGAGQPKDLNISKGLLASHHLGVMPGLRPLDQHENVLNDGYIARNIGGRLSSSHFRNQLRLFDPYEMRGFRKFCKTWLPDLDLGEPISNLAGNSVDLYFREVGHEREISWAGDGFQVFLQILLYLYRYANRPTLVLDEPEVFLHADLQRRLLDALEETPSQVIVATHSSEIFAAVSPESVIWVDKSQKHAVSISGDEALASAADSLGSIFNLRLAKLLRTTRAVFVEGKDLKLLNPLAVALGLGPLEKDADLSVVPLDGASNWRKLMAFEWVADRFLQSAVAAHVILDRDFHSDTAMQDLIDGLAAVNVRAIFWKRHEIENYLLVPSLISRVCGCSEPDVRTLLEEVGEEMRDDAIALATSDIVQEEGMRGLDISTLVKRGTAVIDSFWSDSERLSRLPGKDILAGLNRKLQAAGWSAVSSKALATNIKAAEIDPELSAVLKAVLNR